MASAADDPMPPGPSSARRRLRTLAALLVGVHLAVGAFWVLRNLGEIPHDGDTMEFLGIAAGALELDGYRGVLYPALLMLADRWDGPGSFPAQIEWESRLDEPCRGPRVLIVFQIAQLSAALAALAYFVRVFGAGLGGRERALLTALLLFDPLVGYLNIAILTDGFALSACLVFCAALVQLGRGRANPLGCGLVLVTAYLIAANLRPDKRLVLLAALAVTTAAWVLWSRRGLVPAGAAARAALTLGVVAAGAAASVALHESVRGSTFRWDVKTTVLHQRVIWPHLAEIYDELPESVRARVKPGHVIVYDRSVNNTWVVFNHITRYDRQQLHELTAEIAPIALARTWPRLLLDVASDAVENVLSTFSYYGRLAVWMSRGESPLAFKYRLEATPLTYNALSWHHRRLSRLYTFSAGLLVLLSLCACAAWLLREGRRALPQAWRVEVVPLAAFVVVNAFAFAAVVDLVHIRYAIAAHVMTLFLLYRGALAWLVAPERA
jgi:hypothetical protein